ncbi:MAG: SbcC/MukB-like Walker B domain-containing protein, partial [Butyricicoccaceae bacterium]
KAQTASKGKLSAYQLQDAQMEEQLPAWESLRRETLVLQAQLPLYQERDSKMQQIRTNEHALAELRQQQEQLQKRQKDAEQETEALQTVAERCKDAALLSERCEHAILHCREQIRLANKLQADWQENKHLHRKWQILQRAAQVSLQQYGILQSQHDQLFRLFLMEQSGILAQQLEPDMPCPVCGSTSHPRPAQLIEEAPSEQQVQSTREKAEAARKECEAVGRKAAAAAQRYEQAQQVLMGRCAELFEQTLSEEQVPVALEQLIHTQTAEWNELNAQLNRYQANLRTLQQCSLRLAEIRQEQERLRPHMEQLERLIQQAEEQIAQGKAAVETITEQLSYDSGVQAQQICVKHLARLKQFEEERQALREAQELVKNKLQQLGGQITELNAALAREQQSGREAQEQLEKVLKQNGFSGIEECRRVFLEEQEIAALQQAVAQYRTSVHATKLLVQTLTQDTQNMAVTDISAQKEKMGQMQTALEARRKAYTELETRYLTNSAVQKKLTVLLGEHQSSTEQYLLLRELSDTANGHLTGKQRISFERYVQAAYFDQILIRANQRLSMMSGGRYRFVRKKDSVGGAAQTGLDLDVLDYYTGKNRDVCSLSGGESFEASLALALGMSDIIQQSTGGIRLDMMLIDEGFGALDAESLERAIATLQQLADGERLVGIISHVSELKERIGAQLVVQKGRQGSTIRMEQE